MQESVAGNRFGLTGFQLKMIAMISMLIDHLGAILFPQYFWMRKIGRLAFPIFAFLLVEGFLHTKDVYAYLKRLAIFALISEPFFDFAFYGKWFAMEHQNIFFTLVLSLGLLKMMEEHPGMLQKILWFVGIAVLAELVGCDYGTGGVLTVLAFYQYRRDRIQMSLFFAMIHMFMWGTLSVQSFAVFALIPILLYNGRKGFSAKYAFYVFYPAHLLVLGALLHCLDQFQVWSVMITG